MHAALAKFAKTYAAAELPDDALAQLFKEFGEVAFAPHVQQPSVRYFWWPRFEIIAAWVTEEEARRRTNGLVQIYAEINGSVDLAGPSGPVTVTARADRLERYEDLSLGIIDYKTGVVPSVKMVEDGARNQLSVEALIASEGGFDQVPAGRYLYWNIGKYLVGGHSQERSKPCIKMGLIRQKCGQVLNGLLRPMMTPRLVIFPNRCRLWYRLSVPISIWHGAANGRSGLKMNDLIHRASTAQAHASDPPASVFVSANAGTGKTKGFDRPGIAFAFGGGTC